MNDGGHIICVNGEYRDNTPLGVLMNDFSCNDPDDIQNPILSNRVRYLKKTKKGLASMCKMMEDMRNEAEERGHAKGLEEGRVKGIEEGIEIGANKQTIQMIFDMNENNVAIETIAKCAKKSLEETKRIIAGGRPQRD